jgi:hypothetical protein
MNDYLTQQDVNQYGNDLIDLTQRSALHAVAPHLQALEQQNAQLQQRLAREARRNLDQEVERLVPDYRTIDRDPRWHRFLLGIDPFTGQPFQVLLNVAIVDGDANRVATIFRAFMNQAGDTQQSQPTQRGQAPGRRSSGRPVYSRDDIKRLYRQKQQGAWVGREAEFQKLEYEIIRAGAEGRILNPQDVAGK